MEEQIPCWSLVGTEQSPWWAYNIGPRYRGRPDFSFPCTQRQGYVRIIIFWNKTHWERCSPHLEMQKSSKGLGAGWPGMETALTCAALNAVTARITRSTRIQRRASTHTSLHMGGSMHTHGCWQMEGSNTGWAYTNTWGRQFRLCLVQTENCCFSRLMWWEVWVGDVFIHFVFDLCSKDWEMRK